jgi:cell division protease FtsH
MITQWGFSEKLGPLLYSEEEGEVFLGRSTGKQKNISDTTANVIDSEVKALIDKNYQRAEHLLQENMDKLHAMAEALLKYETIDLEQVKEIMEGKSVTPPPGWDDNGDTTGGSSSGSQEGQQKNSAKIDSSKPVNQS